MSTAPEWYASGSAADVVRGRFYARYGRAPDGVWAAPGRVNLIGEHVDYNGGVCLPFALPHRTYVALARRDDDTVTLATGQADEPTWSGTLDAIGPGTPTGWPAYPAGVAWSMREDGLAVGGFDAVIDGRVPLGSGLSSSAAVECAIAVALDDVHGFDLAASDAGRTRLAALCVRAENEVAGAPTGGMDQSAALRARAGHVLAVDCRDFSAEHLPFDPAAAGLEVLVVDTRAQHALGDGRYGSRRADCEVACGRLGVAGLRELHGTWPVGSVVDALRGDEDGDRLARRVRHVLTEMRRVDEVRALLGAGDVAGIGPALVASHDSMRDDYEISCTELDLAVASALKAGALGGRMTGGGFGGSAIALIRAADRLTVAHTVDEEFRRAELRRPSFLIAHPAPAAGRIPSE